MTAESRRSLRTAGLYYQGQRRFRRAVRRAAVAAELADRGQGFQRIPWAQLAWQHGVSRRTIERDVRALIELAARPTPRERMREGGINSGRSRRAKALAKRLRLTGA